MLSSVSNRSRIAAFLSFCIFIIAPHAQAQTLLRGPGSAALDLMFQEVLKKPADVEVNLAFARRAIELEDFEAAVATMERLLIGRTGLPLIRLELGMLYLRLDAPELAEAYFLQVLDSEEIDDEARQRAQILLEETRAANARGSFGMSVSFGIKHQSNAVARPVFEDFEEQLDLEREFNGGQVFTPNSTPDSDLGTNASLGISYSRELDGLTDRRFNASLNHYGSFQLGKETEDGTQGLDRLDVSVTSLRLGWSLPYQAEGGGNGNLSPFFSANNVNTDSEANFSNTVTLGLSHSLQLGARTSFSYSLDIGSKMHGQDSVADQKDATLSNLSVNFGRTHTNGNYTSLALRGGRIEAETDYESVTSGGLTLSHSFSVFGLGLNLAVGWTQSTRDDLAEEAPLPIRRRDDDYSASLSTGFQFLGITAGLAVNYIDRDSTLPAEKYDDLAGSLTFSRSFQ